MAKNLDCTEEDDDVYECPIYETIPVNPEKRHRLQMQSNDNNESDNVPNGTANNETVIDFQNSTYPRVQGNFMRVLCIFL